MAGFSQGGGVGLTLAEWMVEGEPSRNVFAMDVARFGKRCDMFIDFADGLSPPIFPKRQNFPQMWELEFLNLITVPDEVGALLADALADFALVGLGGIVIGSQYDDINPIGTVSTQFPVGGQQAVLGTNVQLVLSLGPTR